ncbi:hypothetical protein Hanom_Chr00s135498g01816971 [Helianthus anomalus]
MFVRWFLKTVGNWSGGYCTIVVGGSGFKSVFWLLFFFALCGLMLGYSVVLLLPPLVLLFPRRR